MNALEKFYPLRPLRAFTDEKSAYEAGIFFMAISGVARAAELCRERGMAFVRAQAEGVNTAGGYVVPIELIRAIVSLRNSYGVFRRAADVRPMASDTALLPRRTSGLTATFASEAASIDESQAAFDAIRFVAKKLATRTFLPSELVEDVAVDLGEWFAQEAGYALAIREDDSGFNGDGGTSYEGIVGLTTKLQSGGFIGAVDAASGHDTFVEIDFSDLANLISALPDYAVPGARWYVSQRGAALIFYRLAMTTDSDLTVLPVNGVPRVHYMGFPIEPTPSLPQVTTSLTGKVMLAFGDLALCATLAERRGMTIAKSTAGPDTFAKDLECWKVTERVDINVHDIGDASTAGPVVGLIGQS